MDDVTLLSILHELNEEDLINHVIVPLLDEMGFRSAMSLANSYILMISVGTPASRLKNPLRRKEKLC